MNGVAAACGDLGQDEDGFFLRVQKEQVMKYSFLFGPTSAG
jgi:hypothetical protein